MEFEIAENEAIDFDPSKGTISRAKAFIHVAEAGFRIKRCGSSFRRE